MAGRIFTNQCGFSNLVKKRPPLTSAINTLLANILLDEYECHDFEKASDLKVEMEN